MEQAADAARVPDMGAGDAAPKKNFRRHARQSKFCTNPRRGANGRWRQPGNPAPRAGRVGV